MSSEFSGEQPPFKVLHEARQARERLPNRRQCGIDARARLRRQRLVEHLHRLGPAPLGHFLREVENGANIPDHLERYAKIDPAFVRALGGDHYAPALHAVEWGCPRAPSQSSQARSSARKIAGEQGRPVSPFGGRNYAPTTFSNMPDSNGASPKRLKAAMERLLRDKKIAVVEDGPPSKRRAILVET